MKKQRRIRISRGQEIGTVVWAAQGAERSDRRSSGFERNQTVECLRFGSSRPTQIRKGK